MTPKPIPKPSESELEILQVLWQQGPSTVKQVNDFLSEKKPIGYTTTLKTLQIMTEKNLVEREQDGRMHVYAAAITEENTQQQLLNRFMDSAFRGSASKLVMQALGQGTSSAEERQQIRELLDKLEGGK